jgi:hypothetical protein
LIALNINLSQSALKNGAIKMDVIEIKAYVPAKDFELSTQFYRDLGFNVELLGPEMAYLNIGTSSFLLQNFYVKEHAENFMMHMLVKM